MPAGLAVEAGVDESAVGIQLRSFVRVELRRLVQLDPDLVENQIGAGGGGQAQRHQSGEGHRGEEAGREASCGSRSIHFGPPEVSRIG